MSGWARTVDLLLSCVAPRHCAGCDGGSGTAAICTECLGALDRLQRPPPFVDAGLVVRAAFAYAEPVRSLVHRAKYEDARSALRVLAAVVAERVAVGPGEIPSALVPVPLSRRRRRDRGYNQADVVAAALAARLGVPIRNGLVRTRETARQVGHDQAWRRANLADAFIWRGDPPSHLVWIVDDVYTTGATAGAAAAALVAAGSGPVDVVVAARVL